MMVIMHQNTVSTDNAELPLKKIGITTIGICTLTIVSLIALGLNKSKFLKTDDDFARK
jgi:hypothetical protein